MIDYGLLIISFGFVLMCRYSDFVVHEISKQGKMVHLDDLTIPAEVQVRYWIQFQPSTLVFYLETCFKLRQRNVNCHVCLKISIIIS